MEFYVRPRLGETAIEMVVHHTHRLHEGIDDRAPHEPEPTFLKIL